jgi:hypothetical protein
MNTLPCLIVSNGPFPHKKLSLRQRRQANYVRAREKTRVQCQGNSLLICMTKSQKFSVNHSIGLTSKLMEHATLGSDYIETYD